MTWRRVAGIYGVLVALALCVALSEHTQPDTPAAHDAALPASSLLETDADAVRSVSFRKDGRIVRAERLGGRWRVVEPAGAEVPPDLIAATVATLTAGQAAERLGDAARDTLADYGLDTPVVTLAVVLDGGDADPISVAVGSANPTGTAVYARRSDRPAVFLVGMNLRYYVDLIFDAAAPHASAGTRVSSNVKT